MAMKCGLSRLNQNLEKEPKWGFWGNFGPFENVELSRLNPKISKQNWVKLAQLEFSNKFWFVPAEPECFGTNLVYVLNLEM